MKKNKILVVGCGSIGQRHIRNLLALKQDVIGFDPDEKQCKKVTKLYSVQAYSDFKSALKDGLTAGIICSPTSLHMKYAIQLAEKGLHLFIEKPLSHNTQDIDQLKKIVKNNKLVVLVGCNKRFMPCLQKLQQLIKNKKAGEILSVTGMFGYYLPAWRSKYDYRKGYSARKKLGGGVIFDDIHDLDIMCWLFGEVAEVFCLKKKVSRLEIDTEDLAEIVLSFKNGVTAHLHLDYLQKGYRKEYLFIGEHSELFWNYITQEVKYFSTKDKDWQLIKHNTDHKDLMFVKEMKHFLRCIEGKEKSVNDLSNAAYVLDVAIACHQSSEQKKVIHL